MRVSIIKSGICKEVKVKSEKSNVEFCNKVSEQTRVLGLLSRKILAL